MKKNPKAAYITKSKEAWNTLFDELKLFKTKHGHAG